MLYDELIKHEVIIKGNFRLKSGEYSNYYVDIKKTISIPSLYNKIVDLLSNKISKIKNLENYCVMGVPYSGIPFAGAVSYKLNIPLVLLRNKQKTHGTQKIIEGDIRERDIILIEDVMTTGGSIIETIDILENLGYKVKYVFTIFQRGILDYTMFHNRRINYNYLTSFKKSLTDKLTELQTLHPIYKKIKEISESKCTNLILSVDNSNKNIFKNIVLTCAQYVLGIKIHMDIFNEYEREEIRDFLIETKQTYNFIVIEDRKTADICNTVTKQLEALKVDLYADILISHGICGFEFVNYINIPVLIVAQLSNFGNLIDKNYTNKCLESVMNNYNIIGCISQENLGYNKCIYCKPGVRIGNIVKDNFDQQYTGLTKGIDFYIVGRGITESSRIRNVCIDYQNELYNYSNYQLPE